MKDRKLYRGFIQHPVRLGWFFSYLLILIIPLLLCLIVYRFSYNAIEKESQKMYSASLEQIRIDFDAYLLEIQQIQSQLLVDNNIQKITRIEKKATPEQQLILADTMNTLQHVLLNHDMVEDVFVVLSEPDAVLSTKGYMQFSLFYDIYYNDTELTQDQLRAYLTNKRGVGDMQILKGKEKSVLLFPCTTIDNTFGRDNATIVIVIPQDILHTRLKQFQWDESVSLSVLQPDGRMICSTDDTGVFSLPYSSLREKPDFEYVYANGTKSGMLARSSQISNLRYVLLSPLSTLNQSARKIQLYTFVGLLICMLLGVGLSAQLTHQHYHPLSQLIQQFAVKGNAKTLERNEYRQLDDYLRQFFEKKGITEHELWKSQNEVRKYQLYGLLERPYNPERQEQNKSGIDLTEPFFIVILFAKSGYPAEDIGVERLELLQFVCSNIFQEIVQNRYHVEMTDIGEYSAAIVGLGEKEMPESLEQDILFTQSKMQELFQIPVAAAVGNIHEQKSGIHLSYLEALEAADFCSESEELIRYADIRDARGGYVFPLEEERKLGELVAAGSVRPVTEQIQQIYENNREYLHSAGVCRCLAYDILSAMIRGANLVGVNGLTIVSFSDMERAPHKELPERLLRIAEELCEKVQIQSAGNTPANQLCEEIRNYILENFRNPDLNISQTGLHFNLTPTYLSSIFKKETGQSLLGYILKVRMEEVERLLQGSMPIAKIAEQTGFRDSGALIRAFKKEKGMTPGQYRTIYETNKK